MGSIEAVKELLSGPARRDAHCCTKVSRTSVPKGCVPIMSAFYFADWDISAAILDAGADPTAVDEFGLDPLMCAIMFGRHDNVVKWLERFPSWDLERKSLLWMTALQYACWAGPPNAATVKLLLDRKADVGARDIFGFGTLHWALAAMMSTVRSCNACFALQDHRV
mmetsp:Transcript_22149/g.59527  ORF Transcript_22149/g.59527 Transcript_22149/m.59527 type:complete len:166 (-) Transcript_22149:8-505(-)